MEQDVFLRFMYKSLESMPLKEKTPIQKADSTANLEVTDFGKQDDETTESSTADNFTVVKANVSMGSSTACSSTSA